jgi:hypothetical protein
MSTTAIFAEVFVCGLQTLIWFVLLVAAIAGPKPFLPLLKTPSIASVFVVGISYTFGVIFDRLWDQIMKGSGIDNLIRRRAESAVGDHRSSGKSDAVRRRIYGSDTSTAARFIDYNRSRMRIARSSTFNFFLIAVFGSLTCAMYGGKERFVFSIIAALAGTVLSFVSAFAYYDLRKSYYRVLNMASPPEDSENE